uniref:Caspase 9-like protein b n=1 Tax=Plutella xylostella TaxID=51655 RepID=A0A059T1W9_PLUXY|nr:caspase 9-like protein b [Plutella xylostella]
MQEEHRKAIQRNFGSLVKQTDLDVIVSVLYEKGVFSEAMIEPYKDTTRDVRMRKRDLYRDIERRGPTAFPSLLEALTTATWGSCSRSWTRRCTGASTRRPRPWTAGGSTSCCICIPACLRTDRERVGWRGEVLEGRSGGDSVWKLRGSVSSVRIYYVSW